MITDIITLSAAAIIGLAGAYIGRDSPSKKIQALDSYSQCLTTTKDEELCGKILDVAEIERPEKEKETE